MAQQSIILIVDDEPVGRDTLEALLTSQGYQLAFASNGPETLAQARALTPDLILLDIMMHGMDGFEVCRRLRADPLVATPCQPGASSLFAWKTGAWTRCRPAAIRKHGRAPMSSCR